MEILINCWADNYKLTFEFCHYVVNRNFHKRKLRNTNTKYTPYTNFKPKNFLCKSCIMKNACTNVLWKQNEPTPFTHSIYYVCHCSLNKRLDKFFPCSCRYYMTMPNKNIAAVTESINQSINLLTSVRGMGLP